MSHHIYLLKFLQYLVLHIWSPRLRGLNMFKVDHQAPVLLVNCVEESLAPHDALLSDCGANLLIELRSLDDFSPHRPVPVGKVVIYWDSNYFWATSLLDTSTDRLRPRFSPDFLKIPFSPLIEGEGCSLTRKWLRAFRLISPSETLTAVYSDRVCLHTPLWFFQSDTFFGIKLFLLICSTLLCQF